MKLLIDMNLSPRWVSALAQAGIDATHWSSLGAANAADTTILEHAREHGLYLLTHDLDFSAILAATGGKAPSVIQIRSQQVTPEHVGTPVIEALLQSRDDLAKGALLTIDPKRSRLRILPLGTS